MQSLELKLVEEIDVRIATMATRASDGESKARRKVAKLDRTAERKTINHILILRYIPFIKLDGIASGSCRTWPSQVSKRLTKLRKAKPVHL